MTDHRPRRSALYMPGSNPRALVKARSLHADVIIMDLEDAVAAGEKASARILAEQALIEGGYGERETVLRVNGMDTEHCAKDMAVLTNAKPDAVLFPKIIDGSDVLNAQKMLDNADPSGTIKMWLMLETPASVLNAAAIAGSEANRLSGLVIGTNDLAKDSGVSLDDERAHLLPWLMQYVAAAKANGLTILDGVSNALHGDETFQAECRQGRAMGMDGKTLVHPKQIDPCNRVFSPSAEEIAEAEAIIKAFHALENAAKGVISLNGKMVERLHLDMAKVTIAKAERL
ncbi:MAG: CoA ester lyase [Pseudomonadota bacterium]